MLKYRLAFHWSRRALYQPEPLNELVPDLVVIRIRPPLLRPFSAVNPFEMTCTSPTASMFGLTIAFEPSSSTTLTPSTTTFLEVLGMPLIVMPPIDVHVEKSRLRVESCTPGTTVSRP